MEKAMPQGYGSQRVYGLLALLTPLTAASPALAESRLTGQITKVRTFAGGTGSVWMNGGSGDCPTGYKVNLSGTPENALVISTALAALLSQRSATIVVTDACQISEIAIE